MTCESCSSILEENKRLKQKNQELEKRIEQLETHSNKLERQVEEIKSWIWKPNKKPASGRLGPPKGHKANQRPKPDHVDETVTLTLVACSACNNELSKTTQVRERYIEDIKPAKPYVRKYLIHRYYCRHCRRQVWKKPREIPRCRFGLNLLILLTFLRYGVHMPLNKIASQLAFCYDLHLSEGTIVKELDRYARYLGPEFERIKREVKELAALNADETGWRINGRNVWLWDFIGKGHSLFLIRDSRGKAVVEEVLGKHYNGVLTTDCLHTYDKLPYEQQKCWAHLLRETRKMKGREGKILHKELKNLNRLAKLGDMTKEDMVSMLDSVIGKGFTDPWCVSLIKNRLTKFRHEWFTFMDHPDVDDTNNAAERGLRPSVVMRKITGGNRSLKGARNHEVIMSVMQTWEKQGTDFTEGSMEFIKQQLT
jgi:hypothetical protein